MRGIAGSFVALAVALGIGLGAPSPCVACSCVAPVSLAEAAQRSPGLAVFVGKVVVLDGGGDGVATIAVDGRFRGLLLPAVIRARFGGGGDCTIHMEIDERRIFTARLDERGIWFPALCDPQGVLGTPEGDALLAEAVRTFGPPQPGGSPPAFPSAGGSDVLVLVSAAGAVLLAALLLVVGVTIAVRRRSPGPA